MVDNDLLQTLEVEHVRKQEWTFESQAGESFRGSFQVFRLVLVVLIIVFYTTVYLFEEVHRQGEQCQKAQLNLPRALLLAP